VLLVGCDPTQKRITMGKYVATHAAQSEIARALPADEVEEMNLLADALFPMAPPAFARGLWKQTQPGHAIVEPLMFTRDDPHLHLYVEQPGRFNTANKGLIDEMAWSRSNPPCSACARPSTR
jgi:hypothetical protein